MSTDSTPRFGLSLLQPGQAQKELYHNEALALIDLAMHASVEGVGLTTPPSAPIPGACWIVGAGAEGDWAGADDHLAGWTDGGWRFLAPRIGMTAWSAADGQIARFAGDFWVIGDAICSRVVIGGVGVIGARQPAIDSPSGGSVIDGEARATIAEILAAMQAHGLIETG